MAQYLPPVEILKNKMTQQAESSPMSEKKRLKRELTIEKNAYRFDYQKILNYYTLIAP